MSFAVAIRHTRRDDTAQGTQSKWGRVATRRVWCWATLALMASATVPGDLAAVVQVRSTYTYNADGALTAVTRETSDGSETTYLTWDNFVPNVNDPSTGTLQLGNGTLVGRGPSPGAAATTERFEFDPRDRLIRYSEGARTQSYQYRASGMLAEASSGGDSVQLYFDKAENATLRNAHYPSNNRWSGFLERVRYLDDGTEQVLLAPRKDTASMYTPGEEQLQSYQYDSFGAQETDTLPGEYDPEENPFQYSGEYRDPFWGGYYLRARWYHPDIASFISRDPVEHLNRYNYGGGNPVNVHDPAGTDFFHGLGNAIRDLNDALNRGVGGHFARFFLAPLMGPLQIAANPEGFWDAIKHNKSQIDVFLAIGIASELIGGYLDSVAVNQALAISMQQRFLARAASDMVVGFGQSIAAGASRGFNHFNYQSFIAGAEMTIGTVGVWRGVASLNIRSGYRLTGTRAGSMLRQLDHEGEGTALVFRVKTKIGAKIRPRISPFQEWRGLGAYHERLIAVTKSDFYSTDFVEEGVARQYRSFASYQRSGPADLLAKEQGKLEFVGKVENFNVERNKFLSNPRMVRFRDADELNGVGPSGNNRYRFIRNNCHDHAWAVLESLGLRRSLKSYIW